MFVSTFFFISTSATIFWFKTKFKIHDATYLNCNMPNNDHSYMDDACRVLLNKPKFKC